MLGVFLNSLICLGPLPLVSELLMTKEFSFTAAYGMSTSGPEDFA